MLVAADREQCGGRTLTDDALGDRAREGVEDPALVPERELEPGGAAFVVAEAAYVVGGVAVSAAAAYRRRIWRVSQIKPEIAL